MQVEVPEHEQRFQRFLWQEAPWSQIEMFQYTGHIFGAKSSPTCAKFIVQETARDFRLLRKLFFYNRFHVKVMQLHYLVNW